jgi:hypothetical protein
VIFWFVRVVLSIMKVLRTNKTTFAVVRFSPDLFFYGT